MEECAEREDWWKANNSHTFRSGIPELRETRIFRHHCLKERKEDRYVEVPCTEIDGFFDGGFVLCNSKWTCYNWGAHYRTLNTRLLWENVEDKLRALAINTKVEYSKYGNNVIEIYDIPINGHMVFHYDNKSDKRKKKEEMRPGWLKWNGKLYDPSYIYCLEMETRSKNSGKLIRLMPFSTNGNPDFPVLAIRELSKFIALRKSFLEIDLGRICNITHIGTLGGKPETVLFPPQKCRIRRPHRFSGKSKIWKKPRNGFVHIVKDPSQYAWTTDYIVHFKNPTTGQWMQYGEVFTGNNDVKNESIHEIELKARHLRITPLSFHHKKEIQVIIYGTGASLSVDTSVETISYAIQRGCTNSKIYDGFGYRSYREYYDSLPQKPFRKIIDMEMKEFQHSIGECDFNDNEFCDDEYYEYDEYNMDEVDDNEMSNTTNQLHGEKVDVNMDEFNIMEVTNQDMMRQIDDQPLLLLDVDSNFELVEPIASKGNERVDGCTIF